MLTHKDLRSNTEIQNEEIKRTFKTVQKYFILWGLPLYLEYLGWQMLLLLAKEQVVAQDPGR